MSGSRLADVAISVAKQGDGLKHVQPFSRLTFLHGEQIEWYGKIQPTAISREYDIRIRYKIRIRPNVTVLDPPLRRRGDEAIPHMFGETDLCLFRFKHFEWDDTKWIYRTILPWTSLWLYYYELWHATGEWLGGGEHTEGGEEKSREA